MGVEIERFHTGDEFVDASLKYSLHSHITESLVSSKVLYCHREDNCLSYNAFRILFYCVWLFLHFFNFTVLLPIHRTLLHQSIVHPTCINLRVDCELKILHSILPFIRKCSIHISQFFIFQFGKFGGPHENFHKPLIGHHLIVIHSVMAIIVSHLSILQIVPFHSFYSHSYLQQFMAHYP